MENGGYNEKTVTHTLDRINYPVLNRTGNATRTFTCANGVNTGSSRCS
jgi:hypothetical protein